MSVKDVAQTLAFLDGARVRDWPEYERRIVQAADRCGETAETVADKLIVAQRIVDDRGRTVKTLDILQDAILATIPASQAGSFDCTEVVSLWLVLFLG